MLHKLVFSEIREEIRLEIISRKLYILTLSLPKVYLYYTQVFWNRFTYLSCEHLFQKADMIPSCVKFVFW